MDGTYASGDWVVRDGTQAEFVERWTEFVTWTRKEAAGFHWASLIQDEKDPIHFISFSEWDGPDAVAAWRRMPGMGERLGRCRELCERFEGRDYTLAARV